MADQLEILPEATEVDGKIWLHVKSPDGFEGWVLQSVLITATPVPSNTPTQFSYPLRVSKNKISGARLNDDSLRH